MRKTEFFIAFGLFMGLAGMAEATPTDRVTLYNHCMVDAVDDMTKACTALRVSIKDAIQDCVWPGGVQTAAAKNSHSYRAQTLVCTANVRQQFGTVGH